MVRILESVKIQKKFLILLEESVQIETKEQTSRLQDVDKSPNSAQLYSNWDNTKWNHLVVRFVNISYENRGKMHLIHTLYRPSGSEPIVLCWNFSKLLSKSIAFMYKNWKVIGLTPNDIPEDHSHQKFQVSVWHKVHPEYTTLNSNIVW